MGEVSHQKGGSSASGDTNGGRARARWRSCDALMHGVYPVLAIVHPASSLPPKAVPSRSLVVRVPSGGVTSKLGLLAGCNSYLAASTGFTSKQGLLHATVRDVLVEPVGIVPAGILPAVIGGADVWSPWR